MITLAISGLMVGLITLVVALVIIGYMCFSINRRINQTPQPSFDEMTEAYLMEIVRVEPR